MTRIVAASVSEMTFGILIGTLIEALLPTTSGSGDIALTAVELLVQVSLNGAAYATASALQTGGSDPTCGFPFGMGLVGSQPGLKLRIETLASLAGSQVDSAVQKTVESIPSALLAN